jgi:transcriptional regulator with XRE-family HTH domain
MRNELGDALRLARRSAGLSQAAVARQAGVAQSTVSRVEGGRAASLNDLALIATLVGIDLVVRAYPGGAPLRDVGHVRLFARLRALLPGTYRWRTEVPLPMAGDQRAVDAVLVNPPLRIGFELESRLLDAQALVRRAALKQRDARLTRMILVIADTEANRASLRAGEATLRAAFPLGARAVLADLRAGRVPADNGVLVA